MLYADKRALETNLKVQLLEIREKELIFYTNNCQNIGTQAAMLAGFAFAGMMQPLPDEPESLRVLFLVSTVSAFGAPATPLYGPSTARQPALTSRRAELGGPSGSSPQPSRQPSRAPPHARSPTLRPAACDRGDHHSPVDALAWSRAAWVRCSQFLFAPIYFCASVPVRRAPSQQLSAPRPLPRPALPTHSTVPPPPRTYAHNALSRSHLPPPPTPP